MKQYITEFIGTFFLALVVSLTAYNPLAPVAVASMLMVMTYAGKHISGAHYNPAVTLAMLYRRKIELSQAFAYWAVQLVAGCVAGFVAYHLTGIPTAIQPHGTSLQATITEVIFTFALAYVTLNSTTHSKTHGNSYYGLAIGFTLLAGTAFAGGPVSWAVFNPAVGAGLTLTYVLWGGGSWSYIWIYFVGPIIGGAVAGVLFDYINPEEV